MEERLYFPSAGVDLSGVLSDPGSASLVVVLCHGFGSDKNSSTNLALQRQLNEEGIATFRFDFFGHGESEGDFAAITPSIGVQNAVDAVHLLQESYADVAIMGSSFGGYAAAMTAVECPGLRVAVLKCPVSDFADKNVIMSLGNNLRDWKRIGYAMFSTKKGVQRLNSSFIDDALQASLYPVVHKIKIPVLIVHGDEDFVVGAAQSRKIASKIPGAALCIIPGADHRFSHHFDQLIALMSDFILKHARYNDVIQSTAATNRTVDFKARRRILGSHGPDRLSY